MSCEACGAPLDGHHPHLCNNCAANIDRWTKEAEERLDIDQLGDFADLIDE